MFEPTTFEQRMQRHEVRLRRRELSRLDMMCFRLDSAAQWLEIKWSRAQPEDLRLLRRERERLLYEIQLLKIDLDVLSRQVDDLLKEIS